jgi:hypothetical protein
LACIIDYSHPNTFLPFSKRTLDKSSVPFSLLCFIYHSEADACGSETFSCPRHMHPHHVHYWDLGIRLQNTLGPSKSSTVCFLS